MTQDLRYSFSKCHLDFNFSKRSLVDIHKASYDSFLYSSGKSDSSIRNVLKSIFPIHDSYGYVSFEFIDYRIEKPSFSIEECRVKSLTYGCNIYVTFRMILFSIDESTGVRSVKEIKEQEVLLCSIPLMTSTASFIVNGIERIVVCQIHKSPGIFYNKKIKDNKSNVYFGTIIPYRGSRLEFSLESNNSLFFRIDKRKKIPVFHLLKCLEYSNDELVSLFYEPLEFKVLKNGLVSFNYSIDKIIGFYPSFNFRDKDGNILVSKDIVLSRGNARKLKDHTVFYVQLEELTGALFYEKSDNFELLEEFTKSSINKIEKNNVSSFKIIDQNNKLFNSFLIKAITDHSQEGVEFSLAQIMKIVRPSEPFVYKESKRHFDNIFFDTHYYSLFSVGRYKINKVLNLDVDLNCLTLTKSDIVSAIKRLIEIKQMNLPFEDIDHLGNRRIRPVGELVENQFMAGMTKLSKYISEKLNSVILDTALISDLIAPNLVNKVIREFFMLSELSQFMEQINLLSELAHGRKISSLGTGGITRDAASAEVRDIHPTHYGRICPIETPDGQNIGLINSLASYATINKYGFIETPYRKVVNKKVTDEIIYLDASEEENYYIGQVKSNELENGFILADFIPARYKGEFVMASSNEISYVDVAPRQIISIVASLVPFLECNDTARALMGCNMQRQAVPLLRSEAPVVATGMEGIVTKESGAIITAKRSGTVVMADASIIIIETDEEEKDLDNLTDIYHLRKFDRSNQSTFFSQKLLVKIGQKVEKGQILADGPGTDNGELALGKNVLVGFVPWNGYNYEDSIVISQRLISNDEFTSIHIEEFEVTVRDTRLGPEEITRDIGGIAEHDLRYLDESGIIHAGVNVKAGDILVGKVTPKSETPITSEEKLLKAIFGDKISEVKDSSLRLPAGTFGTVVDVKILTRRGNLKDSRALLCEREMISKRTLQKDYELDIAKKSILDQFIKPLLRGLDVKIDKKDVKLDDNLLDNLSIFDAFNLNISDKTVSKKLEEIKTKYKILNKKIEDSYIKDVEKIMDGDDLPNGILKVVKVYVAMKSRLQPGDKMAGRHGNKGVISIAVPVEDMPYMEDGTPIDLLLSPIGIPGRMNIGQVLEIHLGLLSYGIGRKIDKLIQEKDAGENIKKFLLDISTDDNFSKQIKKMNSEEIVHFADRNRKGLKFMTPVFDGAKVEDIEKIADKLGCYKTGQVYLRDGKTGEKFDRPVTVGYMYILKLHHLVSSKMHARSIGLYSLVTQQPLGGKAHFGGQRLGEMECWALQAYGAAYTLQEMLTVKSDDVTGRRRVYESIINGENKFHSGIPESFKVLCKELRSLGFDIDFQ